MNRPHFQIDDKKAKEIATEVYNGFKVNFEHARIDIGSLETLIKNNGNSDGYELAKELEDLIFCDIDTLVVEQLDTISYYVDEAEKELNNKWIVENNIKPLYKVGEEVTHNGKKALIHLIREKEGKYLIREKEGKYLIPTGEGASYFIVDFEKVSK